MYDSPNFKPINIMDRVLRINQMTHDNSDNTYKSMKYPVKHVHCKMVVMNRIDRVRFKYFGSNAYFSR